MGFKRVWRNFPSTEENCIPILCHTQCFALWNYRNHPQGGNCSPGILGKEGVGQCISPPYANHKPACLSVCLALTVCWLRVRQQTCHLIYSLQWPMYISTPDLSEGRQAAQGQEQKGGVMARESRHCLTWFGVCGAPGTMLSPLWTFLHSVI